MFTFNFSLLVVRVGVRITENILKLNSRLNYQQKFLFIRSYARA